MKSSVLLVASAAAAALGLAWAVAAEPVPYQAPPETAKLAPGPNFDVANGYCVACHSADYITTQPRTVGAGFWQAEVTKMNKAYGAGIPDEDAKKIVEYLNATYRKAS